MEDLGVGQFQDWNQGHGRSGVSERGPQTFLESWQVRGGEEGRERKCYFQDKVWLHSGLGYRTLSQLSHWGCPGTEGALNPSTGEHRLIYKLLAFLNPWQIVTPSLYIQLPAVQTYGQQGANSKLPLPNSHTTKTHTHRRKGRGGFTPLIPFWTIEQLVGEGGVYSCGINSLFLLC